MPLEDLMREGFVPGSLEVFSLLPGKARLQFLLCPLSLPSTSPCLLWALEVPPLSICPLFLRSDPTVGIGQGILPGFPLLPSHLAALL